MMNAANVSLIKAATLHLEVIEALKVEKAALVRALDDLVGPGAQHQRTCDPAEHDASSPCIYCCARAVLAKGGAS